MTFFLLFVGDKTCVLIERPISPDHKPLWIVDCRKPWKTHFTRVDGMILCEYRANWWYSFPQLMRQTINFHETKNSMDLLFCVLYACATLLPKNSSRGDSWFAINAKLYDSLNGKLQSDRRDESSTLTLRSVWIIFYPYLANDAEFYGYLCVICDCCVCALEEYRWNLSQSIAWNALKCIVEYISSTWIYHFVRANCTNSIK